MKNFLFSIIIPVYNGELYLEECINSVISQFYSNWEIIIIDDGSTDKSPRIMDNLKSSKIRVFHNKNQGQFKTRIEGIIKSKGDYILFLDCDDKLAPDCLKVINERLQENFDLICFNYTTFSEKEVLLRKDRLIKESLILFNNKEIVENIFYKNHLLSLCDKAFKREKIIDVSYLLQKENVESRFAEDSYCLSRVIFNINNALLIEDSLYLYRMNNKSITHQKNLKLFSDREEMLNKIYQNLDLTYFDKKYTKNNSAYLVWSIYNVISLSAKKRKFVDFKENYKNLKKQHIFKKYFKINSIESKRIKFRICLLKFNFLFIVYSLFRKENL